MKLKALIPNNAFEWVMAITFNMLWGLIIFLFRFEPAPISLTYALEGYIALNAAVVWFIWSGRKEDRKHAAAREEARQKRKQLGQPPQDIYRVYQKLADDWFRDPRCHSSAIRCLEDGTWALELGTSDPSLKVEAHGGSFHGYPVVVSIAGTQN